MEKKNNWTVIKEFYNKAFGFSEGLVELVSVWDILLMCVSGSSNKTIAKFFNKDEEYIRSILVEWLNFGGLSKDIEFNPYTIYIELVKYNCCELDRFSSYIRKMYGLWTDKELSDLYRICSQCYKYEDMINGEWY